MSRQADSSDSKMKSILSPYKLLDESVEKYQKLCGTKYFLELVANVDKIEDTLRKCGPIVGQIGLRLMMVWYKNILKKNPDIEDDTVIKRVIRKMQEHHNCTNHIAEDGQTALYVACRMKRVEIVRYLLELRANPDFGEDGQTPVDWAVKNAHVPIMKLLLENGGTINETDAEALVVAAAAENESALDSLKKLCIEIDKCSFECYKMLKKAIQCQKPNMVKCFLELGASIDHEDDDSSALKLAIFVYEDRDKSEDSRLVIDILMRHIAFMLALNKKVNEKNTELIKSQEWILKLLTGYYDELVKMKQTMVWYEHRTTYHDVLTKKVVDLGHGLNCEMLEDIVESDQLDRLFPFFYYEIEQACVRGIEYLENHEDKNNQEIDSELIEYKEVQDESVRLIVGKGAPEEDEAKNVSSKSRIARYSNKLYCYIRNSDLWIFYYVFSIVAVIALITVLIVFGEKIEHSLVTTIAAFFEFAKRFSILKS